MTGRRPSPGWHRRAIRRAAGAIVAVSLGGACGGNLFYKPVPVKNAIGDSTTTLSGTRLHVYATDRYVVYGPTAESINGSVVQANRAYREFQKYFGTRAPRLAIIVADSAFALAPTDAGEFASRRLHTFVYVRPHDLRYVEGLPPDLDVDEIWPISSRLAREMFAAWVDERQARTPEVEVVDHPTDRHVEPMPLWFVDAAVALISDPGAPDRVMGYLRPRLGGAPTVTELLDMPPMSRASGDTALAERHRRTLVGAAGVGLVLFAVEKEGPRVVGRLANAFLGGRTARDVFKNAQHLPRDESDLDRAWREWVRDEYGR